MKFDYSSVRSFLRPSTGLFSLPLYLHRKPLLDAAQRAAPQICGRVLDVGCGRKPYQSVFTSVKEYVGVDVATSPHLNPGMDRIYDGKTLPFEEGSFDSVICTEVLEHCVDPKAMLAEMARVLCPGGHLFITVPFVFQHHEMPHDYFRFTRFGLKELVEENSLDMVWMDMRGGVYSVWVQSTYLAISYTVSRSPVVEIIYCAFWPIARLVLCFDCWRSGRDEITLGWQLLCQKRTQ